MLSKHYTYLIKGSNIPNLYYSSVVDGVCIDQRLTPDNSISCIMSEENLINLLEGCEQDIVKVKSILFLKELLHRYNLMRYESDILERNEKWVDFFRKSLNDKFGTRDTSLVINYLLSLDFIERDGIYSKSKKKSLSYRLTNKIQENPQTWRVKYTAKIVGAANYRDCETKAREDENFFNKKIYENIKLASLDGSASDLAQKYGGDDFFAVLAHFTEIETKNVFFKEDANTGRRFHSFTSVPRESRREILLEGEETTEVDFSACHPWLCLSFYEPGYEEEKNRYHAALKEGFYRFLAKHLNSDISTDEKYQTFKIGCIAQIFYDYPRQNDSSKLAIFKILFPHLSEIIEAQKHISNSKFSIKLQSMEADLMFDGVFYRLINEEIPAIPIHDAVICKKIHAKKVQTIMEQEFMSKYGYKPEVKIKT